MAEKMIDLGTKIRLFRKKVNMTQEELAEKSNLSVNYISRLERTNNQNISVNSLKAIAEALNIELIDFFDDDSLSDDGLFRKILLNKLNKMEESKAENISMHLLSIFQDLTDKY